MQREKMKPSERAKIFAPFDALKGFREMLAEKEVIKEEKKELSDDMIESLSNTINSLKVGMMILVKHYDEKEKCYIKTIGMLTKIDYVYKRLVVVKKKINILDIYEVSVIEENIF